MRDVGKEVVSWKSSSREKSSQCDLQILACGLGIQPRKLQPCSAGQSHWAYNANDFCAADSLLMPFL
jgi:hypothetical protein